MTREEAIELLDILPLCNECDSNNFPYTCVECGDAFLLAMEALKQPEIVRCKDCKYCKVIDWDDSNPYYGSCQYFNTHTVDADGFCYKAERKDSN